jgi:hypothetical protein
MSLKSRTLGRTLGLIAGLALALGWATSALAAKAPFDLAGPTLQVSVTRGAVSLPIAQAPDLAPSDVLSLKADLPPGQAARYVLVVAFLRGATNPPPKAWFFALKTWEHGGHGELKVTVPLGAQQALIFLAPHTTADFDTLRDAVRGTPGAFVRASQDLNQLGLDRGRLNTFLEAVRRTERDDPARLQAVTTDLARTLGIKLDTNCFQKSADLQAACLMQDQDSLVLDDGQSNSIVMSLSSGASADLMTQLGAAPQMGGGAYSPYVGAVLDVARLLGSMSVAHFQYVPALAAPRGAELQLRLNTAPSFGNVKSVLVAALPPVEPVRPPPLRATDPKADYCLAASGTVLKVDGAPLVFSTGYAQSMKLSLKGKNGGAFDIPAESDAEHGGFKVDTSEFDPRLLGASVEGTLHGNWGFSAFAGPSFAFENGAAGLWRLAEADRTALVVGHDDPVRLTGGAAACVKSIKVSAGSEPPETASFKVLGPGEVLLAAPLAHAAPGAVTIAVQSFGREGADTFSVQAFAPASRVERFEMHAGDASGELTGAGLGAVDHLSLGDARFAPATTDAAASEDRVTLSSPHRAAGAGLRAGQKLTAKVALRDGRALSLPVTILPPRPTVTLLAQSARLPPGPAAAIPIALQGGHDIARGSILTFSIQAPAPAALAARETVEIETADGAFKTTLSPGASLIREDPRVAVATLDTVTAFGPSAFGPLRFRLTDPRGTSDWMDLAGLVRLPSLTALTCPPGPNGLCQLTGANLFLLQAVASRPSFADAVTVPEGFPSDQLEVPRPRDGRLYFRLHDDPAIVGVADVSARRRKAAVALPKGKQPASAPSPVTLAPATPAPVTPAPVTHAPSPSGSPAALIP